MPPDRPRRRASAHRPLVSVVIPTFDRPGPLDAALGSVHAAAQAVRGEVEVIVVNDGGRSVTSAVAGWREKLSVKVVELGQRSGGAATPRNAGIELAGGEYIAFLDDDDLFLPDHLVRGCEPLERGEADFVYLGAVVSDRRLAGLPSALDGKHRKAYPYDPRLLLVANYLHTGSVIVRTFKDTPLRFDPALDVCEDWDMWIGLTTALGYRVAFVDRITSVYHQIPDTAGLVSGAQVMSPSKFAVARAYVNAKWPSTDPLVVDYREWMGTLERFRDELIAQGRRMPNLLFDDILRYLHGRISRREPAEYADVSRFFDAVAQPDSRSRA
jgi:glycosyltransferase involved in cell wall biosynthesis